jgi:hypothetical protein
LREKGDALAYEKPKDKKRMFVFFREKGAIKYVKKGNEIRCCQTSLWSENIDDSFQQNKWIQNQG